MVLTSMDSRPHLLVLEGTARAEDSKHVLVHDFHVPDGSGALRLSFDYAPRRCTDETVIAPLVERAIEQHLSTAGEREAARRASLGRLKRRTVLSGLNNLLNVVLIDPEGRWRGRWDRNPSSAEGALWLGAEGASKGFVVGPIPPGRWQAAVEIHGVFGATVSYRLEVVPAAGTPPELALVREPPSPTPYDRHRRLWGSSGERWFVGEMHSHTVHSDGAHELAELARRAAGLGIDFLSLTDHNATSGLCEADHLPVTIVPGCELTTFHGHHPFYGVPGTVPWHEDGHLLPHEEVIARAKREGALVSVAHPFKLGDPICTGCRMTDPRAPERADLFEVWYRGWDGEEWDNEASYAVWNREWAAGRRLVAVAARDWHGPAQETPFPGEEPFTVVRAKDASPGSIIEGLAAGRVLMSGGPLIELFLLAGSERAAIGDSLRASEPARAEIQLRAVEEGSELLLFRNGSVVFSRTIEADADLVPAVPLEPGWYRAELRRAGKPRAITNHVVLDRPA